MPFYFKHYLFTRTTFKNLTLVDCRALKWYIYGSTKSIEFHKQVLLTLVFSQWISDIFSCIWSNGWPAQRFWCVFLKLKKKEHIIFRCPFFFNMITFEINPHPHEWNNTEGMSPKVQAWLNVQYSWKATYEM